MLAVIVPMTIWQFALTYGRYTILLGLVLMFVLATTSAFLAYRGTRIERNWIAGTLIMIFDCMLVAFCFMSLLVTEPPSIISANESRTACTLMEMAEANVAYAKHNHRYVSTLQELDGSEVPHCSTAAKEIIRTESAAGYVFSYATPTSTSFQITASPKQPGRSGNQFFYVDQDLKVRYDQTKAATAQSPTIGD